MGRRPQKLELNWFNKDQALIPTEEGKYGYTWVDPKDPRYCEVHTLIAEDVVRGVQSPKEEGVTYSERADLEPAEDNLLVLGESGDVLEALTQVPELADKYVGQVKCVYIDPPFNTEQTFANYEDNLEHSIWLTMMRDRLIHLRTLLSDDGSIWVHLDDVENHRMRVLLDEVFGAGNFVAQIVWEKLYARKSNNESFSTNHDFILVYTKGGANFAKLPPSQELISRYKNPDGDPRGVWQSVSFSVRTDDPAKRVDYRYEIELPSGRVVGPPEGRHWNGKRHRYELMLEQNLLWFGKDGDSRPREKSFVEMDSIEVIPFTIWPRTEVGDNDLAKKELKNLFPGENDVFATPKPERLIERILHLCTDPGDIVLDIFGGSGTTAAVAQKMGRRWVTSELIEDTFSRFTLPRLTKIVNGADQGGISQTAGERVDNTAEGLPKGISAGDAQKLTSLLNKAIADRDDLKKHPVIKEVKDLVKTRKHKDSVNWRGGGSFTVARLSPSCFDYDPDLGLTILTEAGTGKSLVESVAANLGFYLTPKDRHFDGILGRQHLAVVEGVLDDAKVDDLMTHLPEGHTLLIAATIVPEGVRDHVRGFKNGSRVLHIPLDLFTYTTAQEGK